MRKPTIQTLLLGGLIVLMAGCGGSSPSAPATRNPPPSPPTPSPEPTPPQPDPPPPAPGPPAPPPAPPAPPPAPPAPPPAPPAPPPAPPAPPPAITYHFHGVAPHATPLPYDFHDEAHPTVVGGHRDSAAVLVYATHHGSTFVLLGRRAHWLSQPGTWNPFMGSVEATDLDDSGRMSFARAAEHELYEETGTVYHGTDATALRACPTHLRVYPSGLRSRTFFSRQSYISAEVFNDGYHESVAHGRPARFQENDLFRWVRLDGLLGLATAIGTFTDADGATHAMELYQPFFLALREGTYQGRLAALP